MKNTCVLYTLSSIMLACLVSNAFSQPATSNVQGALTALHGVLPQHLSVEFVHERVPILRVPVAPDGSFDAFGLAPGRYELHAVDFNGAVLATEQVTVRPYMERLELKIPGLRRQTPASGTVSLRSLMKPLPKSAAKELVRADKAWAKQETSKSFDHIYKALAACPDCVQVHVNLGWRYMRLNRLEDAASAFTKAVELDPDSILAQSNLSIVLTSLRQYDAAEAAAKRALSLDPASVPAGYVLGLVALARRQCSSEAVAHMRRAAEKFPRARLSAAMLLKCRGDTVQAISELDAYLKQSQPEQRESVERWRAELQKHTRGD